MRVAIFALTAALIGLPSLVFADDQSAAPASSATMAPISSTPAAASPASPEIIASAGGGAPVAAPAGDNPLSRWLDDAPTIIDLNNKEAGDLTAPRTIHGEVTVGVGSNGYREVSASAVMPVGKSSELGVAVDDEQFATKRHKFEQRSLAIGLALGGASAAPMDCASAIRVGDHYVEPLWATQIRGYPLTGVDPRCMSAPTR